MMKVGSLALAVAALVAVAPAGAARPNGNVEFFEGLRKLCGQRFAGATDFTATANDPFSGARLVMSVDSCAENEIRIAFAVGEDRSRTWILTRHGDRVLFKHDHRKADGTPDEITMYGGWAADGGSPSRVRFPADDETAKLIPAAATNVWTLEIDPAKRQFVYFLERDGKPRYRAIFDLAKPVADGARGSARAATHRPAASYSGSRMGEERAGRPRSQAPTLGPRASRPLFLTQ